MEVHALSEEYYVLDTKGKLWEVEEYPCRDEELKALLDYEVFKRRKASPEAAPHTRLMKKLKLAEHEELSDAGHLRLLPRGALIFDLLSDFALQIALRKGAYVVHTSNMYDLEYPPVAKHAELFGQKMYKLKPGKREFVLRYAACFGQFSILKDYEISYSDLPLWIFELADSYRYERRGEISGLARQRLFHMPDLHCLCANMEQAKEIFRSLRDECFEVARSMGWTYVSLYNVTRDFLEEERDFLNRLVREEGRDALLHVVEPGKYYWVINVEFCFIDNINRPIESATVQIDVGNAKRFGITYTDADGSKKHPIIIHTAIIGSIERFMCCLLEKAEKDRKAGKPPMLPLWLSPVQVRVIPVSDEDLPFCEELVKRLLRERIRAELDDRDRSVSWKVRRAEESWIPYIVVVGSEERESGLLSVRIRGGGLRKMRADDLIEEIKRKTEGYPYRPLYGPMRLSKAPSFAD